jgi:hypothetical protein
MPFKDGQNFDPLRRESIDAPVIPQEDFSDIVETELRHHTARLRHRGRLMVALLELVDPAVRRWGIIAADEGANFAEISEGTLRPANFHADSKRPNSSSRILSTS